MRPGNAAVEINPSRKRKEFVFPTSLNLSPMRSSRITQPNKTAINLEQRE